ncbi:MAG: efflux RND transporter permease subunit [Gammaproteobacteria bacterium]|nr:efflux RND transporter permease subunit [Gammaproteobacteria bacterium]
MSIASVSVKRPIATTMVFLIIITLGMISFRYLPVDLLPPIEFPQLNLRVDYGNVGPEEMELIITERLENVVAGVPNLEEVYSSSSEGEANVQLRFAQGTNLDEAANDVRAALDRVRDEWPVDAEPPEIRKFDPNQQAIVVIGARSSRPMEELTRVLERDLLRRFQQIPGVGAVDVWGGVYNEINVDLLRDRLIASELTAGDVVAAIGRENVTLPGGNVREGLRDLYVRTLGEYTSVQQIRDTVVTVVDGRPIRIGDVANVEMGFQDIGRYVEVADLPTVRMGVRKQVGANTVEVARQIREEVERINSVRSDLQLQVIRDQSTFIQSSIDNVRNSAIWGGILSVIILLAFLRNGSATMVIAVAIPISIVATFGLVYFTGLTLNQMSFGGIALGVGMIVDNSIVVLENIVRQRQRGKDREASALIGARQVTGAIIASTLTTCVIFMPVVFMRTVTGTLFQELALVVVFALLCSLFIALTLVPMLSSRYLTVRPDADHYNRPGRFAAFERGYTRLVQGALDRRKTVVGVTILLVAGAAMLVPRIPFELAPQTDGEQVDVDMRMDDGTNISIMYEYVQLLDAAVREVVEPEHVVYVTNEVRNNRASVELTLTPPGERTVTALEIADAIRSSVANTIPGAEIQVGAESGLRILRFLFRGGGGGGEDGGQSLQLQLRGHDLDTAERLVQDITSRLETIPGVADVDASNRERRPQQNVTFDRERMSQLGVGVQDVAVAMQTSVGGRRAGVYRIDGEEIDITVRLRPEDRLSVLDLDNISVRTNEGILPISALMTQESGRGPITINRIDSQRVNYISANLEAGVALGEAVERIQQELSDMVLPDGFSIYFGGEYEEQQRAQRDFLLAILMAVALIYMVMAAQFERFVDPLIVMVSVPVAVVGVVPTMLLTGTTLNLQSFMGIVMLVGIVVNNAIVLVDYINLLRREEQMEVRAAIVEACRLRLRPIMMTTSTTVLGLLPLSFGIGTGAELQAALARVVIGGLSASTLITLVLIPVVYLSVARAAERVRAWRAPWQGAPQRA